jgi:hypothetical protein
LVIIIIFFSEPLKQGFEIYAQGQSPTDTINRVDSFALDENLTNYESEKLNEINQRVSNFNDENQFNDTNLVAKAINSLCDEQFEKGGTIRTAFWIILFYQFILNFTNMIYINVSPAYLFLNFDDEKIHIFDEQSLFRLKTICFLFFVSFILFIPSFCGNFFYISMRINKILYIKILALILFVSESFTIFFVVQNYPLLFYLSFLLTILFAYIMQDQLNYFYITIIPSDFKMMGIKGVSCLYSIRYIGSIFGSLSTVFGLSVNYEKKNHLGIFFVILNSFAILVQIIILIFFFKNSNNFADRPIRRIIYSKNVREIRRTEL